MSTLQANDENKMTPTTQEIEAAKTEFDKWLNEEIGSNELARLAGSHISFSLRFTAKMLAEPKHADQVAVMARLCPDGWELQELIRAEKYAKAMVAQAIKETEDAR